MDKLFDDIARILGSQMPRRQALRLFVGLVIGGVVPTLRFRPARAEHCPAGREHCRGIVGTPLDCCNEGEQCCNDFTEFDFASNICCPQQQFCCARLISDETIVRTACCDTSSQCCFNLDAQANRVDFCCPAGQSCCGRSADLPGNFPTQCCNKRAQCCFVTDAAGVRFDFCCPGDDDICCEGGAFLKGCCPPERCCILGDPFGEVHPGCCEGERDRCCGPSSPFNEALEECCPPERCCPTLDGFFTCCEKPEDRCCEGAEGGTLQVCCPPELCCLETEVDPPFKTCCLPPDICGPKGCGTLVAAIFEGGGKLLVGNDVSVLRLSVNAIGAASKLDANAFSSNDIDGRLRAFSFASRTIVDSLSFSFLEGATSEDGDLMVSGEGMAKVNGVVRKIEFVAARADGGDVITFEIFDAETADFLVGGTGESGRAELRLTVTP